MVDFAYGFLVWQNMALKTSTSTVSFAPEFIGGFAPQEFY
jgi:hypothetical protein